MRVLFVSSTFPTDLKKKVGGVYQRMRLFIDAIKEIASLEMLFYVPAEMDVSPLSVSALQVNLSEYWNTRIRLSLCPMFQPKNTRSKWQLYGAPGLSFFQQPSNLRISGRAQIRGLESALQRGPDLVFAHKLRSMCPLMLTKLPLPPVFFDLDDIEHIALWRMIRQKPAWRTRFLYAASIPALIWGERRAIRLASKTFVCSEVDRDYLTQRCRLPGVAVIPNALRGAKTLPITREPTLLFLGTFLYQPNLDAANFLINRVWPQVRQAVPEARLVVAGGPAERVANNGPVPGAEFTGYVEDLESLYRRSRVVCVPILSGGGTRVKIIEAAGYAKPIVATRIGAEGLHMQDGRELLIRDNADSFARACIALLKDAALCERLGTAAYQAAISRYDRATIVQLIQTYISKAAQPQTVGANKAAQAML